MAIIKKQFSTFTVSYEDVEITPNNYYHYGVFVDNEDYGVCIRGGEFNYALALQIRSNDEQQVREVMSEVVKGRQFWLSQLESLLK